MQMRWTCRLSAAALVLLCVVRVEAQPTINSFTANPTTVVSGQTSTLSWNVSNATNVAIGGVGTGLPLVGTFTTPPLTVTTTYQLTATGSGTANRNATITVTNCVPVAISTQPASKSITSGNSTSLSVSVTGTGPFSYQWFRASSNSDESNPVSGGTSSAVSVSPTSTTSYWVRIRNCSNANTAKSSVVTVTVTSANPTASISSSPGSIVVGESSTLTWSSTNASSVSIDNGIGPVAASGSMKVYPQATTKYTITAKGSPNATANTTVTVNPAPNRPILASIQAIPNDVPAGSSITLSWNTSGASTATITGLGTVDLQGSQVLTPSGDVTYRLTATQGSNSVIAEAPVKVRTTPKPVISTFTATPNSVQVGQPVTLSWASTGGTTATLDGDDVPLGGSSTETPTRARAYTYTLIVDGAGGRATKTVSVKVNNAVPPAVDTPAGQPTQPGSQDGSGGSARFNNPAGVGVDGAGNIFVIDSGNHTIRRIATNGTSQTWAGEPSVSGFRDGCRSGCPATALFNFSNFTGAIMVKNDGSLVVTDASNRIRYVDASGKVTTCASASCARFSIGSISEAKDGSGNRYEADSGGHTILKVAPNETAVVLAGKSSEAGYQDGSAAEARFNKPRGIAADRAGNVYVGDTGNNAVRKISPDGTVTTLAASSPPPGQVRTNGASSARFTFGCCGGQVVVDPTKGTVYVTDTGSNTIKEITPGGDVTTIVGSGDASSENGSGAQAGFKEPQGGALTPDGRLVIADTGNHTIRQTSPIIETSLCVPSASTACMLNNRFRVTLRYRNGFDGSPADTNASVKSVTGFASPNFETSFFYFNNENNIELMVKILDQGNTNSSGQPTIAVLYGSASPLNTELSVVDTVTGATRTYFTQFNSMRGQTDFTAFVK